MTTIDTGVSSYTKGQALPTAQQVTRNTSHASENKIHDDDVARTFGFRGGLVPGATSYAYIAGYLTRLLGPAWAAHGSSSIALVRPVYENEVVTLGAEVTDRSGDAAQGSITLSTWVDNPDGTRCAPGTATLSWGSAPQPEELPDFARTDLAPPDPAQRPPISKATAPVGDTLRPVLADTGPEAMAAYLDGIDNHDPLFRSESPYGGPLVHPGYWAGFANRALSGNFRLGPWIHTRSEIRHLAPALAGGTYTAYSRLTDAFEKRGHEYATIDVLIVDAQQQPVVRMTHTAIVVVGRG